MSAGRGKMTANGLAVHNVADNVANMDNVVATTDPAFQERFVQVQSVEDPFGTETGGGVRVAGADFGDPNGIIAYEPNNPLADVNGMVRRPDVDLTE